MLAGWQRGLAVIETPWRPAPGLRRSPAAMHRGVALWLHGSLAINVGSAAGSLRSSERPGSWGADLETAIQSGPSWNGEALEEPGSHVHRQPSRNDSSRLGLLEALRMSEIGRSDGSRESDNLSPFPIGRTPPAGSDSVDALQPRIGSQSLSRDPPRAGLKRCLTTGD